MLLLMFGCWRCIVSGRVNAADFTDIVAIESFFYDENLNFTCSFEGAP